jgi:hypothetical protein
MCFLHKALLYRPTCFDLLLLKSFKVSNCLFLPPVDSLMRSEGWQLLEPWATQVIRLRQRKHVGQKYKPEHKTEL